MLRQEAFISSSNLPELEEKNAGATDSLFKRLRVSSERWIISQMTLLVKWEMDLETILLGLNLECKFILIRDWTTIIFHYSFPHLILLFFLIWRSFFFLLSSRDMNCTEILTSPPTLFMHICTLRIFIGVKDICFKIFVPRKYTFNNNEVCKKCFFPAA